MTIVSNAIAAAPSCARSPHPIYLKLLAWAFALFSSARVVAYLPTIWAIQAGSDTAQHSLWTWGTWLGSNLTMAAWLHEQGGRRPSRAVAVCVANAAMCAVIVALIVWHRA